MVLRVAHKPTQPRLPQGFHLWAIKWVGIYYTDECSEEYNNIVRRTPTHSINRGCFCFETLQNLSSDLVSSSITTTKPLDKVGSKGLEPFHSGQRISPMWTSTTCPYCHQSKLRWRSTNILWLLLSIEQRFMVLSRFGYSLAFTCRLTYDHTTLFSEKHHSMQMGTDWKPLDLVTLLLVVVGPVSQRLSPTLTFCSMCPIRSHYSR